MAGHSKFKNIQHRKGAQDQKRAKLFTRLVREIITAAKAAGIDIATNPRLRGAITAAKSQNLPKERIDKALSQAADPNDTDNYSEIRYEGFAPGGIAIIVEALTDNKNRTAAEVRSVFNKFGANLGETGSVSFMFKHVGIIEYPISIASGDQILEDVIEADASDVITDDTNHTIYTEIESFSRCLEFFTDKYGAPFEANITWDPSNIISINRLTEKVATVEQTLGAMERRTPAYGRVREDSSTGATTRLTSEADFLSKSNDQTDKLLKFIYALEDLDDVQEVFSNCEFA